MDTVEVTKIHKYRALRGELRKCDHQPEAGSIYMFSPLRAHLGNVTKLIRRMKKKIKGEKYAVFAGKRFFLYL